MNFIQTSYENAIKQNEEQEKFWMQNKKSLEELQNNLKSYNESLNPTVLVPVCSRVMMRGNLIHTNEILVSLGCSYFTKCTSKQAQDIIQHRSLKADMHLMELEKEKIFLNNQMEQSKIVLSNDCQEIIEPFDEQKEREWKKQHLLNVRKSKKNEKNDHSDIEHEDIMNKLELLELEEEIEQLHSMDFTKPQPKTSISTEQQIASTNSNLNQQKPKLSRATETRESVIRKRLLELKQSKTKCVTEEDVLKRLDQLQEEEDLNDELESLCVHSDIEEESENSSDSSNSPESEDNDNSTEKDATYKIDIEPKQKPGRRISFADETLNSTQLTAVLNFSHSDTPVVKTDITSEIKSPCDVYEMFPECFKKETKPIIKNSHRVREEIHNTALLKDEAESYDLETEKNTSQHVIIGNIIEHSKKDDKITSNSPNENISIRPVSKFKSMRMASKQPNNL